MQLEVRATLLGAHTSCSKQGFSLQTGTQHRADAGTKKPLRLIFVFIFPNSRKKTSKTHANDPCQCCRRRDDEERRTDGERACLDENDENDENDEEGEDFGDAVLGSVTSSMQYSSSTSHLQHNSPNKAHFHNFHSSHSDDDNDNDDNDEQRTTNDDKRRHDDMFKYTGW